MLKSSFKESPTIKATFSEADIKLLQENENVELVTQESIQFTLPFKKRLYAMKLQGIPLKTIIREAGIDPRILGDKRIENLSYRVNKMARKGVFDARDSDNELPVLPVKGRCLEEQVRELTHQLAYALQEIDFLKKLRMADMEAQKQWESKLRLK